MRVAIHDQLLRAAIAHRDDGMVLTTISSNVSTDEAHQTRGHCPLARYIGSWAFRSRATPTTRSAETVRRTYTALDRFRRMYPDRFKKSPASSPGLFLFVPKGLTRAAVSRDVAGLRWLFPLRQLLVQRAPNYAGITLLASRTLRASWICFASYAMSLAVVASPTFCLGTSGPLRSVSRVWNLATLLAPSYSRLAGVSRNLDFERVSLCRWAVLPTDDDPS